jgi:hypothetical protein
VSDVDVQQLSSECTNSGWKNCVSPFHCVSSTKEDPILSWSHIKKCSTTTMSTITRAQTTHPTAPEFIVSSSSSHRAPLSVFCFFDGDMLKGLVLVGMVRGTLVNEGAEGSFVVERESDDRQTSSLLPSLSQHRQNQTLPQRPCATALC